MPSVLDTVRERSPEWKELDESLPASVTVTRTSQQDVQHRQLIISLDGERIAVLLFGDSVTRELDAGPHRLRVSNTLVWRTVEFTLRSGEQAYFEAINRSGFGTYPMLFLLGVAPLYVIVNRMN
jgi:hypothetical protein